MNACITSTRKWGSKQLRQNDHELYQMSVKGSLNNSKK